MGLGMPFYHMRTFTFFLPGVGKTQRNTSGALVLFLSFFLNRHISKIQT